MHHYAFLSDEPLKVLAPIRSLAMLDRNYIQLVVGWFESVLLCCCMSKWLIHSEIDAKVGYNLCY